MPQQGATARFDDRRILSGKHRYDVGTPREDLRTHELNDDISDLFGPGLGDGPGLPRVASGAKFKQPAFILEAAAAIEAAGKAEKKEAAAERRRERSAALKAAKALEPKAPRKPRAKKAEGEPRTPVKPRAPKTAGETKPKAVRKPRVAKAAPAPVPASAPGAAVPATVTVHAPVPAATVQTPQRRILSGSSIPKYVTGVARITDTVNAKTGPAIVVEVEGKDMTARGIMVWAGKVQTLVRAAIARGAPVTLLVAQPANDRFKPSAPWGRAA